MNKNLCAVSIGFDSIRLDRLNSFLMTSSISIVSWAFSLNVTEFLIASKLARYFLNFWNFVICCFFCVQNSILWEHMVYGGGYCHFDMGLLSLCWRWHQPNGKSSIQWKWQCSKFEWIFVITVFFVSGYNSNSINRSHSQTSPCESFWTFNYCIVKPLFLQWWWIGICKESSFEIKFETVRKLGNQE